MSGLSMLKWFARITLYSNHSGRNTLVEWLNKLAHVGQGRQLVVFVAEQMTR